MKEVCWNERWANALLIFLTCLPAQVLLAQAATSATSAPNRVRTVLTTPLLPAMHGGSLRATLIAVQYGPGDASPPHTHGCPVIVYVLEGRVRSQIGGMPEVVYSAGESFYEPPGGVHQVSANANSDRPARFLAFFICDGNAPLSSDLPHPTPGGMR